MKGELFLRNKLLDKGYELIRLGEEEWYEHPLTGDWFSADVVTRDLYRKLRVTDESTWVAEIKKEAKDLPKSAFVPASLRDPCEGCDE
jgi:hypothetical protein